MKTIEVLTSPPQLDKARALLIGVGAWELVISDVVRYRKRHPSEPLPGSSESVQRELLKSELVNKEESVPQVLGAVRSVRGAARLNTSSAEILSVEQSIRFGAVNVARSL